MNVGGPESNYIDTRISRKTFLRLTAAAIGSIAGIQPPELTTIEPVRSTRSGVAMPTVRPVTIDLPPVSGPEEIADVPEPEIVYEPVQPAESTPPTYVNHAPMTAADRDERKEHQKREESGYFLNDLVEPVLSNSTLARRAQFALQDPDYLKRIDPELNKGRFNFVFLGYGGERELTDLILVCSYNPSQNIVSLISFPRDMQSKRVLALTGDPTLSRINQGVREAKARGMDPFSIIRKDLEDFGLSMDYMTLMYPEVMVDFIDLVGGIKIKLDRDLKNDKFYITDSNGNKFPEPFYLSAGTHKIDGKTAEKVARDRQDSDDYDRHKRQWLVISGFMAAIEESIKSHPLGTPLLFSRLFYLFEQKRKEGALITDYEWKDLFGSSLNNLWSVSDITSKLPYYGLRGRIARYPEIKTIGLNENNVLVRADIPGVYITRPRNGEQSSRKFVRDRLAQ